MSGESLYFGNLQLATSCVFKTLACSLTHGTMVSVGPWPACPFQAVDTDQGSMDYTVWLCSSLDMCMSSIISGVGVNVMTALHPRSKLNEVHLLATHPMQIGQTLDSFDYQ